MALPLSVIIITRNEARHIGDCIASLDGLAAEIIVLDTESSDATAEIARSAGARVESDAEWPGFGPQKNRALALAGQPWVLSLDADERLTPALRTTLRTVLAAPGAEVYALPRLSQFCGQWVHYSGWYPDYVTRLFRRGSARFSDDLVHERVLTDAAVVKLAEPLQHLSYLSRDDVAQKTLRYATAGAQQLFARGRRCGALAPWLRGGWAWCRTWLLRRGFLDGVAGLGIAGMNARTTYLKYAMLRQLHKANARRRHERR